MADLELSDGARLAYQMTGSGPALLLITATSLSAAFWPAPLLSALATTHRVITYDHRGIGASPPVPSDRPISTRTLADDAAALLDDLGLGPAHVLGYSLGSAVAQELALNRPDLVASLVLQGTWARVDGFQRTIMTTLRSPWSHGDLRAGLVGLGLAASPGALRADPELTWVDAAAAWLPRTSAQIAMTVRQWDADLAHDTVDRLYRISVPTTVIAGEQDLLTSARQCREVADLVPGARFVLVEGPGSSHNLMLERPEDWLGYVQEHLRRSG